MIQTLLTEDVLPISALSGLMWPRTCETIRWLTRIWLFLFVSWHRESMVCPLKFMYSLRIKSGLITKRFRRIFLIIFWQLFLNLIWESFKIHRGAISGNLLENDIETLKFNLPHTSSFLQKKLLSLSLLSGIIKLAFLK